MMRKAAILILLSACAASESHPPPVPDRCANCLEVRNGGSAGDGIRLCQRKQTNDLCNSACCPGVPPPFDE